MKQNELWLKDVLSEFAKVRGIELDVSRPVDVCEFLMPTVDIPDETKICLFDLLTYLTSGERHLISMAVSMSMPYFVQKAYPSMSNKQKALARLELNLLNSNDEEIMYYLRHNKLEEQDRKYCPLANVREGYAPVPTTLIGIDLSEYLLSPNDPVVAYVTGLFKDKRFGSVEVLGEDISPWSFIDNNSGPKLD